MHNIPTNIKIQDAGPEKRRKLRVSKNTSEKLYAHNDKHTRHTKEKVNYITAVAVAISVKIYIYTLHPHRD